MKKLLIAGLKVFIGTVVLSAILESIVRSFSYRLFLYSRTVITFFSFIIAMLLTIKYYGLNASYEQKIAEIKETGKALVHAAQKRVEKITRPDQQQHSNTEAEIEEKDFYYAEVRRIKNEMTDLEKKLSIRQAKMNRLKIGRAHV